MTFNDIISQKMKEWNAPNMMSGAKARRGDKLPFSSSLMNYSTYGGIPRNKITEFYGEPGSGKTTSAIDVCKHAIDIFHQEYDEKVIELREQYAKGNRSAGSMLEDLQDVGPKRVLYIDLEHSFDGAWAHTLGIDESDIAIMQPPDIVAEDILQTVQDLIESGEVGLVVLDSIPSLTTRAELEKKYGERTVASLAGLLTVFCRKIVPLLTRYETTLIFINQVRASLDNPYIINTPGGKAVKFYASLRILFKIGTPVDFLGNDLPQNTENPAGYIINAKITKQKSAPWDRKNASYYLMCDAGIKPIFDYVQLAIKKYNIIKKGGAWFTLYNPDTGEVMEGPDGKPVKLNGLAKVFDYVESNRSYYTILKHYIEDDINGREHNPDVTEESDSIFETDVGADE